ncbi:MAG: NAD(P)/FAD-dependent oxidoreductase [Candidatus Nanohaloarchaea archaeon]
MTEPEDLVIVGGGAAAMSAAIYGYRSGMDVTIVADSYGGQITDTDTVENYLGIKSISGPDLADRFKEHMREYDVNEVTGQKATSVTKKNGIFTVELEDGTELEAYSVIVATGGHRRKLGIPGEEEFLNKGVAYCSVCDGPLYQGDEVAVIGGGYAGTEAAVYMSDIAEKVYLFSRSGNLTGEHVTIEKLKEADNVEVLRGATTKKFYGDQLLEGVEYEQDGETRRLEVPGAFIEIGTVPNSDICDQCEKNDSGYIKANTERETSVEGLYAAGDVTDKGVQQLSVSAGQGTQAALNASEYVKDRKSSSE